MGRARDEAGNIWETDAAGNPVRLLAPGGQGSMPADPTFPTKGPRAQADLTGAQLGNRKDATEAEILEATRDAQIRKANAEAAAAETAAQVAAREASSSGKMNEAQQAQKAKAANLVALQNAINDLYRRYVEGPGATGGLAGLTDYFLSDANATFDTAGSQVADVGTAAFKVPGMGAQSDADAARFVAANQPTSWDRDAVALQKIDAIQQRLNVTAKELGVELPSAWFPQGGVAKGALSSEAGPYSTPADRENASAIFDLYAKGAGLDEIMAAMQARGMQPTDEDRRQWIPMIEYREKTRGRLGTVEPGKSGNRSDDQAFLGNAIDNPAGAALTGGINMFGAGTLEGLAPEAYQGLRDRGGWTGGMLAAGEVGGAVGATSALGKIGGNVASRIAPWMLRGGRAGQFGRNLAGDVALGAGYGANTAGDPMSGAGVAALGSTGGQLAGKFVGAGIGGLSRTADATALNARGIPTTFGQDLGGFVKGIEDATTSIPGVGDLVNARRREGIEAFNRAAFDIGGELIGAGGTGFGPDGIEALNNAKAAAYRSALDPVTIDTLSDPQMVADLAQARLAAQSIPDVQPTNPRQFATDALENRIQGNIDPATGLMTGRNFQEAYRGLARSGRERANGDYGHEIGEVTRQGQDVLAGALERQNPGAFDAFRAANGTNRRLMTLADAVNSAGAANDGLFTPLQLNRADTNATKRLTGPLAAASGDRPFGEISTMAQRVLPSTLPDSGTAKRVLTATLAGGAGLGGLAGIGAVGPGDPGSNALGGASILAALALANTKAGQQVLKKTLIDRPGSAKRAGANVRKRAGLFGSASVPLLLEGAQ